MKFYITIKINMIIYFGGPHIRRGRRRAPSAPCLWSATACRSYNFQALSTILYQRKAVIINLLKTKSQNILENAFNKINFSFNHKRWNLFVREICVPPRILKSILNKLEKWNITYLFIFFYFRNSTTPQPKWIEVQKN